MTSLLLVVLFQAMPAGQAVQGVVVDANTGAPLAGAYVSVYGVKPLNTRTDAGGLFRLEGAAGPVNVSRPGYLTSSNVPVRQGQDLSIGLTPEAVVSGKLDFRWPARKCNSCSTGSSMASGAYRRCVGDGPTIWVSIGLAAWRRAAIIFAFPTAMRVTGTAVMSANSSAARRS